MSAIVGANAGPWQRGERAAIAGTGILIGAAHAVLCQAAVRWVTDPVSASRK